MLSIETGYQAAASGLYRFFLSLIGGLDADIDYLGYIAGKQGRHFYLVVGQPDLKGCLG